MRKGLISRFFPLLFHIFFFSLRGTSTLRAFDGKCDQMVQCFFVLQAGSHEDPSTSSSQRKTGDVAGGIASPLLPHL
jgi:hypothetical protein